MSPITTHNRANSIASGLFLIFLGVLFYTNWWWPGILLAIAISMGVKEYLRGRLYDMLLTTCIFGALFIFFTFNFSKSIVIPVLFTLGGIYIIFRELYLHKERSAEEEADDISQEVTKVSKDE